MIEEPVIMPEHPTEADCHTDRQRRPGESTRHWFSRLIVADRCFAKLHPQKWAQKRKERGYLPISKSGVSRETLLEERKRERAEKVRQRRARNKEQDS